MCRANPLTHRERIVAKESAFLFSPVFPSALEHSTWLLFLPLLGTDMNCQPNIYVCASHGYVLADKGFPNTKNLQDLMALSLLA